MGTKTVIYHWDIHKSREGAVSRMIHKPEDLPGKHTYSIVTAGRVVPKMPAG